MTPKGHRTRLASAFIEKMLFKQPNRNKRKSKQQQKTMPWIIQVKAFVSFVLGVREKIHKGTKFFRMGMKDV